jgi:hypothetical protein
VIRRLLPALLAGILLLPAPGYGQGVSKVRQLLGQGWTFLEAGNLTRAEAAFTAAFEDPVGRNSAEVYYAIAAVWWERRNAMAAYMWLSDSSKARKDSFTWDGGPGDEWDQRIDARQRYVESNFTVIKLRSPKRGKPLPPLADPTPQDPLLREFTDRLPRVVDEGVEAKMAVHWVLLPNGTYWIGEELVELGGGQLDPTKAASWELPADRGKAKSAYAERFAALEEGRSMAGEATVAEAEAAERAEQQRKDDAAALAQQRKDDEAAAAQQRKDDAAALAQQQVDEEAAQEAEERRLAEERALAAADRKAAQEREAADAEAAEQAAALERAEQGRIAEERDRQAEADRLEKDRREDERRAEQDRKEQDRSDRERRDAEEREERALAAERDREEDRREAEERRAEKDAQAEADRRAAEDRRAAREASELEESRLAEERRAADRAQREVDAQSAEERRREREAAEEEARVAESRRRQDERDESEAEKRRRDDEKWANAARETEEAEERRRSAAADAQARADAPTSTGDAAEELRGRRFYLALGGGLSTVERLETEGTSVEATWGAHGELGGMIPLGKGALPVALAVGLSYDSLPMSGCSHAQTRGHALAVHIAPRLAIPIKGRTWLQGRAGLHLGAAANWTSDAERQSCAEQRSGEDVVYGVRLESAGASATASYGDLGWDGYALVFGPDFEVGILGAPGAAPVFLGAAFFLRHDQVFAAIEGGDYHLRAGDTSGVELETVELSALDASASMPRFQLGARATVLF